MQVPSGWHGQAGPSRDGSVGGSVVAIWNELTPYRLHVLGRLRRELREIHVVNFFTHSVSRNSMPWQLEPGDGIDIRFEEALRIPRVDQFLHSKALRLCDRILDVVDREKPVFVLMSGHRDLVRLATIARLRSRGVPVVHSSDANALDELPPRSVRQLVRSRILHLILEQMSGYMPMGVAGRAFYDMHGNRSLPHFPFPYEPDYGLVRDSDPIAARRFAEAHGLHPGRRRFLYSGRLVAVKRVDVLIDAFASIAGACEDWDLVIAGRGPLESKLRRAVPASLEKRVRFLGFLQMDELRFAYACSHALVHPSEREPWGLVINEAVAAGLAVIATDVTGAALELVRPGTNGLLVRPRDPIALARAMSIVARPGTAEVMGASSLEVLSQWQRASDPVEGFRQAFEYFRTRRDRGGMSGS